MPYRLTGHDYQIKYRNTFAGYKTPKGIEIVYLRDVEDSEEGPRFHAQRWNGSSWTNMKRILCRDKNLILQYPYHGAVNLSSGFVIIVERRCERMWRVTMNEENTYIVDPFKNERKHINEILSEKYTEDDTLKLNTNVEGTRIKHNQLLRDIFFNEFYTPDQAVELVNKGKRFGAAINPGWFIGITKTCDYPLLFKKQNAVAIVDDDKFIIPESIEFLKEEIGLFGKEVVVK